MGRSLGLLDFEGRSYPGWHHHMALVSAAYAFRSLGDDSAPGDAGSLAGDRLLPTVTDADRACG